MVSQVLVRGVSRSTNAVRITRSFTNTIGIRSLTSGGYIEETVIPTFHFQDSLPKLPVPKLEDTLKSYEYFAEPMVTPEEFQETKKAVEDFKNGAGSQLQTELEAIDKAKYSSFISEPWFNMYLEGRDALMINVNPQLTFKDDPNPAKRDQTVRAASLIHCSIAFYRTLRDGKLKPDIFHTQPKKSQTSTFENLIRFVPRQFSFYGAYLVGAYPLDMSQYDRLFSSTRIPRKGKDELVKFDANQSRHIVVQYGSEFFPVDVLNEDGSSKSREEIEGAIGSILSKPANRDGTSCIGVLSSLERDRWAAARETIETTSAENKKSLEMIDSALFAVCLEEDKPEGNVEVSECMLHGDATNRWFDKSFQLIVCGNGKAAVNFEHAWGDGVAVLRYFNEVHKASNEQDLVTAATIDRPTPLSFDLTPEIKTEVESATKEAKSFIDSIELKVLETETVNRKVLKDLKLGPDGFLQMSYQLAHEKMHGFTPATYESASTSAYKHGRTETIRSATPEAAKFAKTFVNKDATVEEKGKVLRTAINRHGEITKDALMGKGVDRHLFALRDIEARRGDSPSPIFQDKAYQVLNKIILSTSTLSSEALDAGGFGPVNQDCYGIGYGINDTAARFGVTSYHRGSAEFLEKLEESLKEMREVAEATK